VFLFRPIGYVRQTVLLSASRCTLIAYRVLSCRVVLLLHSFTFATSRWAGRRRILGFWIYHCRIL